MKVRILTKTHEHEDQPVEPGTVLDVSAKTATHLVQVQAAEFVEPSDATSDAAFTGSSTMSLHGGAD